MSRSRAWSPAQILQGRVPVDHVRGRAAIRLLGRIGGQRRSSRLAQHGPQGRQQLPLADRLGDVLVHARFEAPLAVPFQGVGRHGDDRHVPAADCCSRWRMRRVASRPSSSGICTSISTTSNELVRPGGRRPRGRCWRPSRGARAAREADRQPLVDDAVLGQQDSQRPRRRAEPARRLHAGGFGSGGAMPSADDDRVEQLRLLDRLHQPLRRCRSSSQRAASSAWSAGGEQDHRHVRRGSDRGESARSAQSRRSRAC